MDAKSGSVLPTTPRIKGINDRLALASQRSVPEERTPAIAGLKCRILLTCGYKTILPYGMTSCYASNNYQQKVCVSKVGG